MSRADATEKRVDNFYAEYNNFEAWLRSVRLEHFRLGAYRSPAPVMKKWFDKIEALIRFSCASELKHLDQKYLNS